MLTEQETNRVWENMVESEVRSLYFADLAASYTRRKQILTYVSFFLSSGAAATIAARMPEVLPLILASTSAFLMAYSIAVGLDGKAANMEKLHSGWNQLADAYERLWNHWYEEGAATEYAHLRNRSSDLSQMAVKEGPYNKGLIEKCTETVYARYERPAAAA